MDQYYFFMSIDCMFSCFIQLYANIEMCVLPPFNSILLPTSFQICLPYHTLKNPLNCTPFLPQNNPQICPPNHPFKNPQFHPFFWAPKQPPNLPQIHPLKSPNCTHFLLRNSSQICPICAFKLQLQNLKKNYPILTPKHLEIMP